MKTLYLIIIILSLGHNQSHCNSSYIKDSHILGFYKPCILSMDHIENATSNSSSIIVCAHCLAMAVVLLLVYEAVGM
jgi:hypothetical protein